MASVYRNEKHRERHREKVGETKMKKEGIIDRLVLWKNGDPLI